ncbi:hypothetical protein AWC38_SpisGene3880 [Stylophora pistillata]|uniref:Uncharacterized protein n=1 Tax=Stylophora pistillata TaxID=50429 RepID=A0A2B4SS43_STYPI|nr:hypothetical protein AWC38_SpisGene3880 [Stylophora pistillata]
MKIPKICLTRQPSQQRSPRRSRDTSDFYNFDEVWTSLICTRLDQSSKEPCGSKTLVLNDLKLFSKSRYSYRKTNIAANWGRER